MPQITCIDGMRCDAQDGQEQGEAIYEPEERLDPDDGVDEIAEEASGEDGVFLDELGEVVEAGGYGEGEKAEAEDEAEVA